jgi:hypothetical protein
MCRGKLRDCERSDSRVLFLVIVPLTPTVRSISGTYTVAFRTQLLLQRRYVGA